MTAPLIPTTDRPYQLLPPLTAEQRHILRQSIEKNGVLEPVVFDEDGEILDGHHRVEIAEELNIDYPRRVITDLDRPGKHMFALTVNVARRQLDQTTRSGLVAQMRIRGMSVREIAKATGVSYGTVRNDLAQVSKTAHLPEAVTGADGKKYASTRPTPTPGPTDAALSPPAGAGAAPAPAADESPALPTPQEPAPTPAPSDAERAAAAVQAALDKFVPDVGKPQRDWQKELYVRVKPVHTFLLWLKTDDVTDFADEDDLTTLRHLATSFADAHRRAVEARNTNVTPLRRIK